MTLLPPGVKVHLAMGYIDMRKGIDGLAMLVQPAATLPRLTRATAGRMSLAVSLPAATAPTARL